jgi:hypothetical protein
MTGRLLLLSFAILCLGAGMSVADPVGGAASFGWFDVWGLTLNGAYSAGVPWTLPNAGPYTLGLDHGAYILYGGYEYPIENVWGFWAVNSSGTHVMGGLGNDFYASGSTENGWTFDQKQTDNKYLDAEKTIPALEVAGWYNADGKDLLMLPGESLSFSFASLNIPPGAALPKLGIHVTVSYPTGAPPLPGFTTGYTGNIIPVPIPEYPAVFTGAMGLCGVIVGRRRRPR